MAARVSRTISDKVAVLRKADLFGSLPEDLLKKIAGLAVTRSLSADQLLYSEDDEASALFVVAHGELRSIRQNRHGREQVLSTERSGAVLAAVPVFNGGKFFSTIIADAPSEILVLEKHHVHQLCREHTELLWNLARVLAHKVRHYAELIESLALHKVEERVAQHLVTVARERGMSVGEGCIVELMLTRGQMASRIGSAREVVSRALAHLQKSGLIQMDGRRLLTIPNVQALVTFAGTEHGAEPVKLVADVSSEIA